MTLELFSNIINAVEIAFLLHLYQPPTQKEETLRKIASECYIPLFKLLKSKNNIKFTLNIPLSLLELMDKYGYSEWLNDVKSLLELEKIELTGCAAYHPILTKIPSEYVEREVILNEFGLGYYFGSHRGFEGETSILVKNLNGFFPPEMAVNMDVLRIIDSLKYDWLVADGSAVSFKGAGLYEVSGLHTQIMIRDTEFSNVLSFKRDSNTEDIEGYIDRMLEKNFPTVVALDAEAFGHHNKEGISLLELLLDRLNKHGAKLLSISELIEKLEPKVIDEIVESSWGVASAENVTALIYPYWDDESVAVHKLLWDIQKAVIEADKKYVKDIPEIEGIEAAAIWKNEGLAPVDDKKVRSLIEFDLLVLKSLQSDQFWWASNKEVYDSLLFSPEMVQRSLDLYKEIAARLDDPELIKLVAKNSAEIEKHLNN